MSTLYYRTPYYKNKAKTIHRIRGNIYRKSNQLSSINKLAPIMRVIDSTAKNMAKAPSYLLMECIIQVIGYSIRWQVSALCIMPLAHRSILGSGNTINSMARAVTITKISSTFRVASTTKISMSWGTNGNHARVSSSTIWCKVKAC